LSTRAWCSCRLVPDGYMREANLKVQLTESGVGWHAFDLEPSGVCHRNTWQKRRTLTRSLGAVESPRVKVHTLDKHKFRFPRVSRRHRPFPETCISSFRGSLTRLGSLEMFGVLLLWLSALMGASSSTSSSTSSVGRSKSSELRVLILFKTTKIVSASKIGCSCPLGKNGRMAFSRH